jgi:hypothetical protein
MRAGRRKWGEPIDESRNLQLLSCQQKTVAFNQQNVSVGSEYQCKCGRPFFDARRRPTSLKALSNEALVIDERYGEDGRTRWVKANELSMCHTLGSTGSHVLCMRKGG